MMQVRFRSPNTACLVLWMLSVVAASGCSTSNGCPICPQPPPPVLPAPASGGLTISMCGSDSAKIAETIYDPEFAKDNLTPEVLFLSAGGSWGAWGAGVLHEWLQETNPPKFDIVIGASTGALLGTFALIGKKEIPLSGGGSIHMLDNLKKVYTTVNDADVYKRRFALAIPFSNSINTLAPLRELAEKTFPHEVIDEVGKIYETEKRQLWVGTTNLDSGEFCSWNLSELAAQGKYDEYIDLLIASSANPGVFDPVYIPRNEKRKHQDMHADGGVRHQLYAQVFEKAVAAYAAVRTKYPAASAPVTYAIVNGQLSVRRACVEDHIVPIMLRSLAILQTAAVDGDLHRIWRLGDLATPKWSMKMSFVPETYELWPSPDRFRDFEMKQLFDEAQAVSPAWYNGVPNFTVSPAPCLKGTVMP